MKIRDLMTKDVAGCPGDTNLAAAGALMWEHDCGFLPVVDGGNQVIGVITDRDICIALCTRNLKPSELTAAEIAVKDVVSCAENDDVRNALGILRDRKVHRLPVVDGDGYLRGIVSTDDIVMCAEAGGGKANTKVPFAEVIQALQAISAHHQTRPLVVSAG